VKNEAKAEAKVEAKGGTKNWAEGRNGRKAESPKEQIGDIFFEFSPKIKFQLIT